MNDLQKLRINVIFTKSPNETLPFGRYGEGLLSVPYLLEPVYIGFNVEVMPA